jgi:hypothetical protein
LPAHHVVRWSPAVTRTPFDRFGKQLVRDALEGRDPAEQPSDDQEFLMNTQDIVETWRREAIQEGVKQGVEQGERKLLLRQLRRRFGAEVDGETERCVAAAPAERVEVWAERVLSAATLAELFAD